MIMKLYYKTKKLLTTKNKNNEVFYRESIKKELNKYLEAIFKYYKNTFPKKINNNKIKLNNSKKFTKQDLDILRNVFNKNINKIVKKWLLKVIKNSDKNLKLNNVLLPNINNNKKLVKVLKLVIDENVRLIKSIADQSYNNISNIVANANLNGKGLADIQKNISNQYNVSFNRSKIIARDQTAKLNEAINRYQQQEADIEYYEWDTSHDIRVSDEHKKLQGKIFKWNEPIKERMAIIDNKGTRGYPAERVNCRCTALAVILDEGAIVKWNEAKGSYEVLKGRLT